MQRAGGQDSLTDRGEPRGIGEAISERSVGFDEVDLIVDDEVEEARELQMLGPRRKKRERNVLGGNHDDSGPEIGRAGPRPFIALDGVVSAAEGKVDAQTGQGDDDDRHQMGPEQRGDQVDAILAHAGWADDEEGSTPPDREVER